MSYEKQILRQYRKDRVKFHFRRFKKLFSKNPYFKADDIRQVGKTSMLIKMAGKTPSSLIVVPTMRQKEVIEKMCEGLLGDKHPMYMPRVVPLCRLTRDDFKYARNVFIEEPMDSRDIQKLNNYAGKFRYKIKLSYAPLV